MLKLNREQVNLLEVVKHLIQETLETEIFVTEGLNQSSPLSNIFEAIGKELLTFSDDKIVYESNN